MIEGTFRPLNVKANVMKKSSLLLCSLTSLIIIAAAPFANGANDPWNGSSGVNLFWLTPGNWAGGSPGPSDDALFFDVGTTNDNISPTSIVTANTTIHALRLGQTNGFHNLIINSGVTLTVSGTNHNGYGPLGVDPFAASITNALSTMFAGPWPGVGGIVAVQLTNTISGAGKLVLNNTNNDLVVRYCNGQNVVHYAILDMSGLSMFTANLARIAVGYGQPGGTVRAMGRMLLARTNILTLSGTNFADNVQLIVGDNSGNNDGNSTFAFLHLGQTNRINVDRVLIGGQKTPGQVLFNTNGIFTSPTLFMRGSDGVNRVTALRIGDESDTGATGSPTTGTLNLLAGTADILVDTIVLGKSQNGNNTALATGNLLMGDGTLNVNTLEMAAQANSGYGGTVTGNATFSNTTVTVNTLLRMGRSAGSAFPRVANLNVTGGSMTVNGSYQNEGTVNINVTNATLSMPAGSAITARNVQLDGATLSGATSIKATNALNIYNNGVVAGAPILDLGNGTLPAAWDVQGVSGGSLTVNNALRGKGTVSGNIIQASGASLSPGGLSTAGALTIGGVSGNLTLNHGGTLNFDLSGNGLTGNDQIFAGGTLTLNGTNDVFLKSLAGSLDTVNPYTLITSSSLIGNSNQFRVTGPLLSGRYTFKFDTTSVPNSVLLVVGGTGPANQTWVGDGLTNTWDAQGATNWNSGAPSQFFNLDNVTFNDTGSDAPAVNVVGALVPGTLTVSNSAKNYAFKGSGSLSVAGPLNKQGAGSLTFSNANDNAFSSLVTISNGAVVFANNGQNTFSSGLNLYGGSMTLAGNSTNVFEDPNTGVPIIVIGTGTTFSVLNSAANNFNSVQIQLDGSLIFNQPIDSTLNSSLINSGLLQKSGAAKLTISGNNASFTGPVLINGGTVIAGSGNSALGLTSVVVTNNAALDINGKNLGAVPITISGAGPTGAGALVNNGGPQNTSLITAGSALHNVTLGTNATIGGSGHWNTDPILNLGYFVITDSLLSGGPRTLTKVGQNQISIMNAFVDGALGDIDIKDGMLNFHGTTSSMGDSSSNIIVRAGATLSFYDTSTSWDKKFVLFGDGVNPTIFNYNGTHSIVGSINLTGNCLFSGAPVGRGLPVSLTCSGPINGSGALVKPDPQGALILLGANDYTGTTTVSGGSLIIDGVSATNTLTVSAGTLGGIGLIRSRVFIQSGAVLSPGDQNIPLSNLSISNSLSLAGTNVMDVFKSGSTVTADLVTNITTLTLGGRLQVNLAGDPLIPGDSIKLYSFTSASGAFSAIIPSSPGFGLLWDTSHLTTDGTLRIGSLNTNPTNLTSTIVGNQLNLSWPSDHLGWRLQAQTNSLGVGLSGNWVDVPGSDTVTNMSFTIDRANGTVFYRMIYP
jgi:autotransporter-associated beta strand protein